MTLTRREFLMASAGLVATPMLGPRAQGLRLEHAVAHGLASDAVAVFDEWLGHKIVGWAAYNPIRPEPDQRNTAQTIDTLGLTRNLASTTIIRDILVRACKQEERHVEFGERRTMAALQRDPALKRRLLVGREMTERDLAQREITIMADKALPYDVLKRVMATCTDADYGRISLAVIQKEKPVAPGQYKPA